MYTIPFKSLFIILVISLSLSLAAIAIIPMYHEASAKECNDNSDKGHSSCSDKQDPSSNNHEHSDSNSVKKDITPFVLAVPFP